MPTDEPAVQTTPHLVDSSVGRKRAALWTLVWLSPIVGEVLSSSTLPGAFLNPVPLFFLLALYGGGALLCRELTFRWGGGWPTLLLLGAAYGIVEEGLMVKSFFNPNWMDLNVLAGYGSWGGVNWIWALKLTVFHMAMSVCVPVALVQMLYPSVAHTPWLGRRGWRVTITAFALVVVIGFAFMNDGGEGTPPYRPPLVPYALCLFSVCALVYAARRAATSRGSRAVPSVAEAPAALRWWASPLLYALGFAGTIAVLLSPEAMADAGRPAWSAGLLLLAETALALGIVYRLTRGGRRWRARHLWALTAGLLTPYLLLAVVWETGTLPHPDGDPSGMGLVAALFVLLLALVRLRVARSTVPEPIWPSPRPAPFSAQA